MLLVLPSSLAESLHSQQLTHQPLLLSRSFSQNGNFETGSAGPWMLTSGGTDEFVAQYGNGFGATPGTTGVGV